MQVEEIRVYGICIDELDDKLVDKIHTNSLTNDEFIDIAEEQGLVWTLNGFQTQFNNDEITSYNCYIRFLKQIVEI